MRWLWLHHNDIICFYFLKDEYRGISSLFFFFITAMPGLSCRFYQHRFPEVEDVVMVNVRSIAEMGAYVSLLEYNNIEGMILLSELSRRRIRSINKLIRIGRNECVVVIRVDKEKGKGQQADRRGGRWPAEGKVDGDYNNRNMWLNTMTIKCRGRWGFLM